MGRAPAIVCGYCRTLSYRGRKDGEGHDKGCRTAALIPRDLHIGRDGEERALFCQRCGQSRSGDPVRWALQPTDDLWCPRCQARTPHHPAPAEVVAAEECLCGACRTRRKFDEDATSHRRIAA